MLDTTVLEIPATRPMELSIRDVSFKRIDGSQISSILIPAATPQPLEASDLPVPLLVSTQELFIHFLLIFDAAGGLKGISPFKLVIEHAETCGPR